MSDEKIAALAKFLDEESKYISESRHDDCLFEHGRDEYLVLTDEEADQRARDYILESLWAFRASFILSHSDVEMDEEDLEALQGKMCEGANKLVRSLLRDVDHFVDDAIRADGRGHFLSGYDGEENEAGPFFIYRVN